MSFTHVHQGVFYDQGYTNLSVGDKGFPDLKIVDYSPAISQKKILSIGGGNCADLWFLSKTNEIHAVDGSVTGVMQAGDHGISAKVGDASQPLPYQDEYFDIIVLKDILEHIYNPLDLLAEAKRLLKPDGYIIVSLPNHFYLPFRLRMLFGKNLIWKTLMHDHTKYFEEWDYMHIRFFTWSGVKKMVRKVGMRIEKEYWDFGTLAHYNDPLMYQYAFSINNKEITTRRQWFMYKIMLPIYSVFNGVFPKGLRAVIVKMAPGLFCAGFYIRLEKDI